MIRLTAQGITHTSDLAALRSGFALDHVIRLPMLLSSDILERLQVRMERGSWEEMFHDGIGRELVLGDTQAVHLLQFLANAPGFLAIVREITGCEAVTRFEGRIYRMLPNGNHYDSWHSDLIPEVNRLVGMSINLSPRPYLGGVFHLRDAATEKLLCALPNVVCGDAILFRISDELQHFVSTVEGTEPKTAFAGWFNSTGKDFVASLKQTAERARREIEAADSCD